MFLLQSFTLYLKLVPVSKTTFCSIAAQPSHLLNEPQVPAGAANPAPQLMWLGAIVVATTAQIGCFPTVIVWFIPV